MKKKTKKKLDSSRIFSKVKNTASISEFSNSKYCGLDIAWTMKDVGFGHLTLFYDRENGKFGTDTECMSQELIEKIIKLAASEIAEKFLSLDSSNDK